MIENDNLWLSSPAFSDLIGFQRQSANRILRKSQSGKRWKKTRLVVRLVKGRGGKSGMQYEVLLTSLPWEYQKFLIDFSEPSQIVEYTRPIPAANQGPTIERKLEIINEALDYAPGTPDRKYELERAAKKYGKTVRTLQRYCKELADSGGDVNALAHKSPSNAGKRRVQVSRIFDKAFIKAGYPADKLPELSEWIDSVIAALLQRFGKALHNVMDGGAFNWNRRQRSNWNVGNAAIHCQRVLSNYRVGASCKPKVNAWSIFTRMTASGLMT